MKRFDEPRLLDPFWDVLIRLICLPGYLKEKFHA